MFKVGVNQYFKSLGYVQILLYIRGEEMKKNWAVIVVSENICLTTFVGCYDDALAELKYAQVVDHWAEEIYLVGDDGTVERYVS